MLSSTWFNVAMLIIFPPIGILTMFIFSKWNIILKLLIAVVMSGYTIILLDSLGSFFTKFS